MYGDGLPFQQKKSGWWPALSGKKAKSEEDRRSRRWFKRLARRVNRIIIEEEQREVDPTKIHV